MNAIKLTLFAMTATVSLSACGSESPEPTEQIVIREPGEAATPVEGAAADADGADAADLVAAGKSAFAACVACHSVTPDGASSIGPNLYGVVGRAAGSLAGFDYSDAMAGSGLTWDSGELDEFLTNPSAKVPGTRMVAGAVNDADDRAAIIAYLATLSE